MKDTIRSGSDFADRFAKIRPNHFSRAGLCALYDHLEEFERSLDEELEFDAIGLCCEWTEYENATEACAAYGHAEEDPEKALEWLRERTQVVEAGESVLVFNF
jgi:hypothetical protein